MVIFILTELLAFPTTCTVYMIFYKMEKHEQQICILEIQKSTINL